MKRRTSEPASFFGAHDTRENEPLLPGEPGWYETDFSDGAVVRAWGMNQHDAILRASKWYDMKLRDRRREKRKPGEDEISLHERVLRARITERGDRSDTITLVHEPLTTNGNEEEL